MLKPVALIKHASTRGGQLAVLPAGWGQACEALWGIYFPGRTAGLTLTQIYFYKYPLPNVVAEGEGCLSGQGKELEEAKTEGKKRGKEPEEVRRKGSAGVGGLQRGSDGPMPRILLCGCSFGFAQVPEGGVPERPLARGVETLALRPLSPLPAADAPKYGCWCPGPLSRRRPPPNRPRAGSHRVGCGGSVAGSERRQGDGVLSPIQYYLPYKVLSLF